jgi:glycerol-3-phosphate dehydrogenase
VYSVVGGKLTTARSLAEQTVEVVLQRLGIEPICDTRDRVIPGGEDYPCSPEALAQTQQTIAAATGCTLDQVRAVWPLCGTRAAELLAPSDAERGRNAGENVRGTQLPLRFVRQVIRDEWPRRLADLVERRLMLLYDPRLSLRTLRHLAELMAEQRVIDESRIAAEVEACAARLSRCYGRKLSGHAAQQERAAGEAAAH